MHNTVHCGHCPLSSVFLKNRILETAPSSVVKGEGRARTTLR